MGRPRVSIASSLLCVVSCRGGCGGHWWRSVRRGRRSWHRPLCCLSPAMAEIVIVAGVGLGGGRCMCVSGRPGVGCDLSAGVGPGAGVGAGAPHDGLTWASTTTNLTPKPMPKVGARVSPLRSPLRVFRLRSSAGGSPTSPAERRLFSLALTASPLPLASGSGWAPASRAVGWRWRRAVPGPTCVPTSGLAPDAVQAPVASGPLDNPIDELPLVPLRL